ncbi:cytochrome d ubiquinol oxidase subunit II [Desulfuromonas thiophila]|uniref:Cytochrome bd-I ubiquinol oxidase subunit 2 apoprotein n=1 Tax=Desulfuromonas thiophila TaxID=57664 RepID=A0A1G7DK34_9BACT|nr:cytochrome d ubiquinol oxidase subunit II [Desulfuromonas thiophila]SDE51881.1 cytochrome bd-I ubiquinol oxidase subunit 2 apoprotein [Desulfuromonas thiophila]
MGNLDLAQLQQLWWLLVSVVGALFIFLTFVQGGQGLLLTLTRDEDEKTLIINSLGKKWELTFTTLVLFGGAFFAAFPLFYATSFGGAYWVWMLILFTFVLQAVSYEYRRKPSNLLGARVYEYFLFINGTVGILLIGIAVGTFFTGSNFSLNAYNSVTWHNPGRGVEAAFSLFNLSFGLFLVFLARVLGALYLNNNIDYPPLVAKTSAAAFKNLLYALPFLLYVLVRLLFMKGYAVDPQSGTVFLQRGKYLANLLALPVNGLGFLLIGLVLVVLGVALTYFKGSRKGIWPAGLGTVLVVLAVFAIAGYNNTAFYPSRVDLQSSLTLATASSSHYTLTAMSYIALAIPVVLAYVAYVWRLLDARKLGAADLTTGDEKY